MGKDHPIIFTTESVKAILDGKKTQTRRVVTPYTSEVGEGGVDWSKFCWDGSQLYKETCKHGHTETYKAPSPFVDGRANVHYPYEHQYLHVPWNWEEDMTTFRVYPRWEVGDRLWVRETFWYHIGYLLKPQPIKPSWSVIYYDTDTDPNDFKTNGYYRKQPSIFMPRWASRLALEITGVRVGRLQEITYEDCFAEGVKFSIKMKEPTTIFRDLWDSINGKKHPWSSNPWCWVISFKRLD